MQFKSRNLQMGDFDTRFIGEEGTEQSINQIFVIFFHKDRFKFKIG